MTIRNFFTKEPKNNSPPKSIVLLLHGYGSTGRRMLAKFHTWENKNCILVSPDAPQVCEKDLDAFQWCSIKEQWSEYQELRHENLFALLNETMPDILQFIDGQLQKYDLKYDNLYILGFSQGSAMTLHTGLLMPQKCAGIIAIGGRLVWLKQIQKAMKNKPEVLLIHGKSDDVVSIDFFYEAEKFLQSNNVPYQSHAIADLDHSINSAVVDLVKKFVEE